MSTRRKYWLGILVFGNLYWFVYVFIGFLPNPAVPDGYIAINMIIPVISGYLLGPWSGFLTSAFGVGTTALVSGSPITTAAIVPMMAMGYVAGYVGRKGNIFLTSLTILVGHSMNILYFLRLGLITIDPDKVMLTVLSLLSESAFDIVMIIILTTLLRKKFYQRERW